uniref:Uncharacterized protein n=1 Tax=Rhizophora mucronata TaxID=61149 RepID=A0A2P2PJ76_RHIMU
MNDNHLFFMASGDTRNFLKLNYSKDPDTRTMCTSSWITY